MSLQSELAAIESRKAPYIKAMRDGDYSASEHRGIVINRGDTLAHMGSPGFVQMLGKCITDQDEASYINLIASTLVICDMLEPLPPKQRVTMVHALIAAGRSMQEAMMPIPLKVSCREGCSFCCHYSVSATRAEIDEILAVTELSIEQRVKVTYMHEQMSGKDPASQPTTLGVRAACVFLKDNSCSVYENRPSMCRLLLSLDDPLKCRDMKPYNKYNVIIGECATTALMRLERCGTITDLVYEKVFDKSASPN